MILVHTLDRMAFCLAKTTYLENWGEVDNLAKNWGIGMNQIRYENGNRVRILCQGDRNRVDKDRHDNPTTSTCQNHVNELERRRSIGSDGLEDLASFSISKVEALDFGDSEPRGFENDTHRASTYTPA